jgi:hypothetical protein
LQIARPDSSVNPLADPTAVPWFDIYLERNWHRAARGLAEL